MVTKKTTKKKKVSTDETTKQVYPKVTVGSHLTVTEYEDGRTELVWDDEALLKEVREALAGAK